MKIFFDEIFAVVAPGLEAVCAEELGTILGRRVNAAAGGIFFSGTLEDLYRANLWSRIASRFLVRVGTVKAKDFPELYRKAKRLPWGKFVRMETPVAVKSSSRLSRLNHSGRISETVSEAINGALGRLEPAGEGERQTVYVRFENDNCQFSVDSSGELLFRRGYRTEISRAPLRETLAAGILALLDWHGSTPLYDPMCGSGTFLIEGAQKAAGIAPGGMRSFAFQRWPKYRDGLWRNLLLEGRRISQEINVAIAGSDIDPDVVAVAQRNAERAGVADMIKFEVSDIEHLIVPSGKGLVLCNPPYGLRMGEEKSLRDLYQKLGRLYSTQFSGWQGALFCPSGELAKETGLNHQVAAKLDNGGLETHLFTCDL